MTMILGLEGDAAAPLPSSSSPITANSPSAKPAKSHFSAETDISLLKEILLYGPYAAKHGCITEKWDAVTASMRRLMNDDSITRVRVRERFSMLIARFKADELKSLRSSGTEEAFGEREVLLTDLTQRIREVEDAEKKPKTLDVGTDARRLSLASLKEKKAIDGEVVEVPDLKRRKIDIAMVLQSAMNRNHDTRMKELEFQKDQWQEMVRSSREDREQQFWHMNSVMEMLGNVIGMVKRNDSNQ